jgi:hypothetical protein
VIPPDQRTLGGAPVAASGGPGRRLARAARARPATLALGFLVLAIGLALAPLTAAQHHDLVARLGVTPAALRELRLWTLLVSPVVQSDPGIGFFFFVQAVTVFVAMGLLEPRVGAARALLVFFGSEMVVEPVRLLTLAALDRLGSAQAGTLLHAGDTGSSAAVTAVFAAFAMTLSPRRRRVGLLAVAAWVIGGALYFPIDVGIDHAAGALCGVVVGLALRRRAAR